MLLCMKRSRAAIEPRQAQLDNQQRAEQNRYPGASKEVVLVCSGGPVELRVNVRRMTTRFPSPKQGKEIVLSLWEERRRDDVPECGDRVVYCCQASDRLLKESQRGARGWRALAGAYRVEILAGRI